MNKMASNIFQRKANIEAGKKLSFPNCPEHIFFYLIFNSALKSNIESNRLSAAAGQNRLHVSAADYSHDRGVIYSSKKHFGIQILKIML